MKNIQDWEKFRAWDKKNKKMYFYTFDDLLEGKIYSYPECLDYEWSKFIRLKDKNDVEIYEGDICKRTFTDEDKVYFGKIVYNICSFQWLGIGDQLTHAINSETVLEVIGNIYENPELLEGKK